MSKRTIPALLALAVLTTLAFAAAPASAATAGTFTNPTRISPPIEGSAQPSPIQVSGLAGPIEQITVSLHGVTHQKPEDFDILLVSPLGDRVVLASDACGASNTPNETWVFPTYGSFDQLPIDGPCGSGVYRDSNYSKNDAGDSWPTAPPGLVRPYHQLLGEDANGTWSLHVVDDNSNHAGSIESGWTLGLSTVEPDVLLPTIGTWGRADPYPMRTAVSGQNGVLTDLDVVVGPLWHERLEDLDISLVGPQGQKVKLMSDSCGNQLVRVEEWQFDDEVGRPIPDGASSVCERARFAPTDNGEKDEAPPPAPPGPSETALSAFDLTDPNGEWRLYVWDNGDGKTGWIANGVSTRDPGFRVIPTIRPRARVAFAEADVRVTEGEEARLVLERTAQGELGAGSVTLTAAPGTATEGGDYRPVTAQVSFAAGDPRKAVSVETIADELAEAEETLTLTVSQGTGDAQPGTPASTTVTIRDPERGGGAGGGGEAGEADTIIEKAPKGKTERRRGKVLFRATEPDARFECKLDRAKFRPCASPRKLKKLRPGRHRFRVRAVDADGNVDPTPAKRRWRVIAR